MSDSLTVSSTLSEISTALHEYSSTSNLWDTDTISDKLLGSPGIVSTDSYDLLGTKRRKLNDFDESGFPLYPWVVVPNPGHLINVKEEESVESFVFHDYEEEERFNPYFISPEPLVQYKYGLQVDKLSGVKRLKDPKRWCVLPVSESTVYEVPLVDDEDESTLIQVEGHVVFSKATYYVDKQVYRTKIVTVNTAEVYKSFSLTITEAEE